MVIPNPKANLEVTDSFSQSLSGPITPLTIATGRHDFVNKKQLSPAFVSEQEVEGLEADEQGVRNNSRSHWQQSIMASWQGKAEIKGSSERMRMALLTFCMVGIQFTWGIEMSYCTPYLLALGLTKSKTSLVWIAGPISGIIVAPVVGVLADRSHSKYGRRRPFMVVGSMVVAAALTVLGWTKEIVRMFMLEDAQSRKTCTIALAVLAIYVVDFAINAVMWSCRSLIVDSLPVSKQQAGAAWSSRMAGIGHLIGYIIGTLDLVQILGPRLGDTQFKKLILFAAFGLLFTIGVTSWAVTERVLVSNAGGKDPDSRDSPVASLGLDKIFGQIYTTMRHLPPRIEAICWVQFWSWIGWFPFLFYSTTWVGETYFRYDAPHDVKQSNDALGDIGRIGSLSLVIFSLVSFAGSMLLPILVKSPEDDKFTHRPPASLAGLIEKLNKYKPDLLKAWFYGHLMFSAAMFLSPFAHSFRFATSLVAMCGLPYAVASWAPHAFLGIEVNKLSSASSNISPITRKSDIELQSRSSINIHSPSSPHSNLLFPTSPSDDPHHSEGELSGIYFGILNIYNTIPQFLGTFISMIVFAIMEPGKSPELAQDAHQSEHHEVGGTNAITICLGIGAASMLGAAYATKRLSELS